MARRFAPVLLLLAVGLLPATATANVPLGSTALMRRPAGFSGSLPAGLYDFTGFLTAHAVSQNGRYVVFMSTADGMAPNDNDGVRNVYVRDTQTNTTTLVSAASDGTP